MNDLFVLLQEIDGRALLLLRSDAMIKYMGLKLGPALKLAFHIDKLKQARGEFSSILTSGEALDGRAVGRLSR